MKRIKSIVLELELGDFGEDIVNYSGYICDIISEIADNNIDIYDYQLWDWAKGNEEHIQEAIDEGLYLIESGNFDLIKLFQSGQYLYNSNNLYENMDDIVKYYIYSNLELEEISEEIENFINELNIDNSDRIETYLDLVTDYIEELESEEE